MTQDEHSALEITLSLANFRRKNQNKSKRAYRQKHDKPVDNSVFKPIYEPGDDALNDKETLESVVKDASAEALSRAKRSSKKSFEREFEAIRDVIDDHNLSIDPPAMSDEERIRIFLAKHDTKTVFDAVCDMLKDRYKRESDEFISYFSAMFSDVLRKKLSL
jgi:hypothetical protein